MYVIGCPNCDRELKFNTDLNSSRITNIKCRYCGYVFFPRPKTKKGEK